MLFCVALLLISIAHFVRVCRSELFISTYEKPNRKYLLRALSIGNIINSFIPFHLGDLVRADIAGRKMDNGRGFSLAVIIVERFLDVFVVGLVFTGFYFFSSSTQYRDSFVFYCVMTLLLVLIFFASLLFRKQIKKIIVKISSLFNKRIEFRFLRFFWSLIWNFKNMLSKINIIKLIVSTAIMWILYLSSYFCFSESLKAINVQSTWQDIFYNLFAKNSFSLFNFKGFDDTTAFTKTGILSIVFMIVPSVVILIISFFVKSGKETENEEVETYINLIPHLDEKERLTFLETYFFGKNRKYIETYLKLNQSIQIIRDFSAGSNATTMLCQDSNSTFFRKYAFEEDGEKLYQQILWLDKHKDKLKLTDILRYEHKDSYCYYDMPFNSNAVSMFSFAHSAPLEKSWAVLEKVLQELEENLYKLDNRISDEETIKKYVTSKVDKNIQRILNAPDELGKLMKYDELIINGISYPNLKCYLRYLSEEHLLNVFKNDKYSVIHGDLTIENIICIKNADEDKNYYIIDPNTGNIHDSSNLDYAKLLQSLHGGYEFLMAQKEINVKDNRIDFPFLQSETYKSLYRSFDNYLVENFSESRVKSIYYHEIIHWLRLMPYKIEKNGLRAILFYAEMLIVINDIITRFEEDEKPTCFI